MSRAAGRRFDAEHGVTTEAILFLGSLDPEAIGPNLRHATHYEATPPAAVDALLDAVPIRLEGATFVDLGSGMGRAVFIAARRPFRTIVGVEISPALHEVARENERRFHDPAQRCRDLRFVRRDVVRFAFPRGDLVVYLYNPFDAEVLGAVLTRLVRDRSRDVVLLYNTPVAREAIEELGLFAVERELPCGIVYRLPRESRGRSGGGEAERGPG